MDLLRKIDQLLGNFTTHDGIIVLTYHHVNDKFAKDVLAVDPKEFARQMLFLNVYRNAFQIIGMDEALKWFNDQSAARSQQPVDKRTRILITFDDGYKDNYTNAFPLLSGYGFPATIFLTTDNIDSGKREYLSMKEIDKMKANKISFGAHTKMHPHLSRISHEQVKDELIGSYQVLETITDRQDIPFCYPYGDYNEYVKNMVKETGFSCAFSVKPGINYPGQDIFEIKRIDVLGNDNFSSFKYKITDKYEDTSLSLNRG